MSAPLSDDRLIEDLRDRGLVGPITADFLAEYRQHRTFLDLMEKVEASPGGPERLRRGMIQLGIIAPDDVTDSHLLAGWASFRAGVAEYGASGPDAPKEVDAPAVVRWETADDVIAAAPATTVAGALVKLRRAVISMASRSWIESAIVSGNDAVLFGQARELDYPAQLVIDAIAALELVQAAGA